MQSEHKMPVNLYGILDNELTRMHELLKTYMTLPYDRDTNVRGGFSGGLTHGGSFGAPSSIPEIYRRIMHMQEILLAAISGHDTIIQEKVAELALTSTASDTKVP